MSTTRTIEHSVGQWLPVHVQGKWYRKPFCGTCATRREPTTTVVSGDLILPEDHQTCDACKLPIISFDLEFTPASIHINGLSFTNHTLAYEASGTYHGMIATGTGLGYIPLAHAHMLTYIIVHVSSGLKVMTHGSVATEEWTRTAIEQIAPLTDWSRSYAEIKVSPDFKTLMTQLKRILNNAGKMSAY